MRSVYIKNTYNLFVAEYKYGTSSCLTWVYSEDGNTVSCQCQLSAFREVGCMTRRSYNSGKERCGLLFSFEWQTEQLY